MTDLKLSPGTEVVLDAYIYVECGTPSGMALAYALRAAANQLNHPASAHTLYSIADEVEAWANG
jgi:hypothetical protein